MMRLCYDFLFHDTFTFDKLAGYSKSHRVRNGYVPRVYLSAQ
jgi:hypothetical protein